MAHIFLTKHPLPRIACAALSLSLLFLSNYALAARDFQNLVSCSYRALTDEDRTTLARWMLYSITSHPDVTRFNRVPPDRQRRAIDMEISGMLRRITEETCEVLFKGIPERLKPEARLEVMNRLLEIGFEAVINSQDVQSSLGRFREHLGVQVPAFTSVPTPAR